MEDLDLYCPDGPVLRASLDRSAQGASARGAVVIAGALGVPRQFYARLGSFLAAAGYPALRFDYRGSGDSVLAPGQSRSARLDQWGSLDLDTAIGSLREAYPDLPLFLLGHSCGGQLAGLARRSTQLAGMIFVAASLPQRRYWPPFARLALLGLWRGLIPLLALGRARFPARAVGLGSANLPAGVVKQWARLASTEGYLFSPSAGLDTTGYGELQLPILSLHAADDRMAPAEAVKALDARYHACTVQQFQLQPPEHGGRPIGHMGYFRKHMATTLWPQLLAWMNGVSDTVGREAGGNT